MTLRAYLTLAYLMVALVFSVLLGTSQEWRDAVRDHMGGDDRIAAQLVRGVMLVAFGCTWPAVLVYWLFT